MSAGTRSVAVLAVVSVASLFAAPARAQSKDAPRVKCDDHPASQVFAPWDDAAAYALAPGGGFEKKPRDWTFEGGAALVPGNHPFPVAKKRDETSLSLPDGSRAVSSEICLGGDHPSVRFFLRRAGGPADAGLGVDALVTGADGVEHAVPLPAAVAAGETWAPTAPLLAAEPLLAQLGPGTMTARLRFTPSAGSSWVIDDVYVDPWRSR